MAQRPGQTYNPLFIHGGVGLGKTHLLHAICLDILEPRPDALIHYTSCEGFMTQFIDAVQAGERVTLTVRGEPVADVVPHGRRARWLPGERLREQLAERAGDAGLRDELDRVAGQTLDQL